MDIEDEPIGRNYECKSIKLVENEMTHTHQDVGEQFVRLALAIGEHRPEYVDAYFGPEAWKIQTQQDGKQPLPDLAEQIGQLTKDVSQTDALDAQRRDYLARHLTAMQMSVRLLS